MLCCDYYHNIGARVCQCFAPEKTSFSLCASQAFAEFENQFWRIFRYMEKRIYRWMKQYNKPASLKRMQRELSLSSASGEERVKRWCGRDGWSRRGARVSLFLGRQNPARAAARRPAGTDAVRLRGGRTLQGRHRRPARRAPRRRGALPHPPRRGKTPPQAVVQVTGQAHEVVTGRYTVTAGGDGPLPRPAPGESPYHETGEGLRRRPGQRAHHSVPSDSGLPARGTVESVLGDGNDAAGYLRAVAVSHGIPCASTKPCSPRPKRFPR